MDKLSESLPNASSVVYCPHCQIQLAEVGTFLFTKRFIKILQSEYIVFACPCPSCGKVFDLAYWLQNPTIPIEGGEDDGVDFDSSLRQRYEQALMEVVPSHGETYVCDAGLFESKGSVDVDLEFLKTETGYPNRPPVIPMAALTLARGVRHAAVNDHAQFFSCRIGTLSLSLGVTDIGSSSGMQLSVFNNRGGGPVSDLELRFVASLVFTVDELKQSYESGYGRVREVIVPLPSVSLNDSNPDAETRKAS